MQVISTVWQCVDIPGPRGWTAKALKSLHKTSMKPSEGQDLLKLQMSHVHPFSDLDIHTVRCCESAGQTIWPSAFILRSRMPSIMLHIAYLHINIVDLFVVVRSSAEPF
jgi:hypothetical protein